MKTRISVVLYGISLMLGSVASYAQVSEGNARHFQYYYHWNHDSTRQLSRQLEDAIVSRSGGLGLSAFILPGSRDYKNIPQDPANPLTRAKVNLGALLFHETAVGTETPDPSRVKTYGCASCHHVDAGFKAGIPQGIGDGGVGFGRDGSARVLGKGLDPSAPEGDWRKPDIQPVASPTVLNSAYQEVMLWDGSFGNHPGSINNSVAGVLSAGPAPIKANTFGLTGVETQVLAGTHVHRLRFDAGSVLQTNRRYKRLYRRAYRRGGIGAIPANGTAVTEQSLGAALAIAAYERTVLSNEAPFQRWLRGSRRAMSSQQLRGGILFFGKAGCADCHTGPALSSVPGATANEVFHAIGFSDLNTRNKRIHGTIPDHVRLGRGGFTGQRHDNYKFKIPQLYNLADADVFGHGASFTSVRAVIKYKNRAVAQNRQARWNLSPAFKPLGLSRKEIDDLVVFVEKALYDARLHRYVPRSLPTGSCFPVADFKSQIELGCW